jgi:predicted DNA-binding transcriptional regulator YafY
MNRIDRISAILIQLQSRRVTKAHDISTRFGISLRTVYRDVKTLEQAGVPLIGEAGVGYSIMDGYRLPPVMFTREEAIAFLTAEKLVEQFTDASNSAHYRTAMYKIKSVLRSSEKDMLENMDNHIEVQKNRRVINAKPGLDLIQPILKSIAEKTVMSMRYFALYKQEYSERCIEPCGVIYLDNYWHLIAFCRERNDYRDFRLDRIQNITLTDEKFDRQHPSVKDYIKKSYNDGPLHEVVLHVEKEMVGYLGEQKYYHGFVSERRIDDKTVEMNFLSTSIDGMTHWYMMFATHATIIKPQKLKDGVKTMLQKIAEKIARS